MTKPLSETFCLGLAIIGPHTKFEVSMFTHYKDMKGNTKWRNWRALKD